jgi:hypothetical protein
MRILTAFGKNETSGTLAAPWVSLGTVANLRAEVSAAWADFDVSAAEKSPRRWLRVLAECGQEFIRAGNRCQRPFAGVT